MSVATANAQAAAGDREAIRLSLAAELATAYFQLRVLDAEIVLLNETTEAYEKSFQLTQNQYSAGLVAHADVAQAQTLLESARAQTIDVRLERAQTEHAIATLMGEMPAAVTIAPLPVTGEPPKVPAELTTRLLERRPDIAAAERRVAAANAQIGVATAAFFPTLGIAASGGFQTTSLQKLLSWPSGFWSVGPALAYTLFDGGTRRAVKAQAQAAYDVTVGSYRETVLAAFQDVEDNLAAQRLLADEFDHQQLAVVAAQQALTISLNQVQGRSHQLPAGRRGAGTAPEQPAQRPLDHGTPLRGRRGAGPRPGWRLGWQARRRPATGYERHARRAGAGCSAVTTLVV